MPEVERLDAHRIASNEEAPTPSIPDCEGEHPAKFTQAFFAPLPISLEDHFGVGVTAEVQPLALQLGANFAKVVDLSVVDDPVAGCRIVHGLMPLRRQIQDCKAAIPQADFDGFLRGIVQNDGAAVVRSTVGEGLRRALQQFSGHARIKANDAEDSAHPNRHSLGTYANHLT